MKILQILRNIVLFPLRYLRSGQSVKYSPKARRLIDQMMRGGDSVYGCNPQDTTEQFILTIEGLKRIS